MSASHDELRERDAHARAASQRIFDCPLILEAGAGTGKTAVLVARVVCWALGPGWTLSRARVVERSIGGETPRDETIAGELLSRIVAITFTEMAAAEMAERIALAFEQVERCTGLATGAPDGEGAESGERSGEDWPPGLDRDALASVEPAELAARARALRASLDRIVVRTIHAWCRRVLARFPLEAGLHPRFEVDADGSAQRAAVRFAIARGLEQMSAAPENSGADLLALAARGQGPRDLEEALSELIDQGVSRRQLAAEIFSPERVEPVLERFSAALGAARKLAAPLEAAASRSGPVADTLDALAASEIALSAARSGAAPLTSRIAALAAELRAAWSDRARSRVKKWGAQHKPFGDFERDLLGDAAAELGIAARALHPLVDSLCQLDVEAALVVQRALVEALGEAELEMRRRGQVPFSGLLRSAHDLLRSRAAVAARIRSEIDLLLVDEFQDTDALQCELVRVIGLASGTASTAGEAAAERGPALFLVGDPKQSIYGWRQADLAAYQRFADDVIAEGGEKLALHVNFRSRPEVLDEVTRAVGPVMHYARGLQPNFEELVPCEARSAPLAAPPPNAAAVEAWVSWAWDGEQGCPAEKTSAAAALALEAPAIARDLRRLHDEHGMAWERAAILLRTTSDLEAYLSALREHGVPYAVARERSYYQRREVVDAAAALRCVLDPSDTLALATFLRSAAVGVPDAALLRLWQSGLPAVCARLYGARDPALEEARATVLAVADALENPVENAGEGELGELAREVRSVVARVAGWQHEVVAALQAIAVLRECFEREAPDRFVERLRSLLLIEVAEASRYLGNFRAQNLARFFRELRDELCAGRSVQTVLRMLRSDVVDGREREAEVVVQADDAVAVMTIHAAKGLDFDHVYLPQLHKLPRNPGGPIVERIAAVDARPAASPPLPSGAAPVASPGAGLGPRSEPPPVSEPLQRSEPVQIPEPILEWELLGAKTLGASEARAHRARVEAAERVRTLYVALTRARDRLVLVGSWAEPAAGIARSYAQLLAGRRTCDEVRDVMQRCAAQGDEAEVDADGVRWMFPALAAPGEFVAPRAPERSSDAGRTRAPVDVVTRTAIEERMQRPWSLAVTAHAHSVVRDRQAWAEAEPGLQPGSSGDSDVAALAGTAVHALLERIALVSDAGALRSEFERARRLLPSLLASLGAGEKTARAVRRSEATLERFVASSLLTRFAALADHVVARELPLMLPAKDDGDVAGPVGFVSGAIDLVHRDPDSPEQLVVVDYKTDAVEDRLGAEERAQRYAPQGALYVDALQHALGLQERPRFELWFLNAGEFVVLDV